jgi:hypothetical protein
MLHLKRSISSSLPAGGRRAVRPRSETGDENEYYPLLRCCVPPVPVPAMEDRISVSLIRLRML